MGGVENWGGKELLKKMEYAGVVDRNAANELSALHGIHDILRQSLAHRAESRNAYDEGDKVVMSKNYHNHYTGYMTEVQDNITDLTSLNHQIRDDPKIKETKSIVGDIHALLSSCNLEVREDPATMFKRQYYVCDKSKESDLIQLNRATSNVHRVWETKLAKSFKGSEVGESPTPEQCMIVKLKNGKKTPKWATEFCKPEHFRDHKDLSALVLACENKGAILMRRLDVSAGENEGLHSTQIVVRPKQIRIKPNVDGIEKDYDDALKPLNAKNPSKSESSKYRVIALKSKKDMEDKVTYLGEHMNDLIRPNTNMPFIGYKLGGE